MPENNYLQLGVPATRPGNHTIRGIQTQLLTKVLLESTIWYINEDEIFAVLQAQPGLLLLRPIKTGLSAPLCGQLPPLYLNCIAVVRSASLEAILNFVFQPGATHPPKEGGTF